jgi:tripartite-type tricarboxylate transporter receptor subunit TctC
MRRMTIGAALAAILPAILAQQAPAKADALADFYKGKDVALIVGFDVGGGYDHYARTLARHIGRHVPGAPNIVVQNMPGAGGVRAANQLYNVSPRDGTVLGMIDQALPTQQLIEPEGMKTDVGKFNWIGRIASNGALLYAWHTAPVQKIEDAFEKELIVSSSGQSSRMLSALMKNQLGLKLKILTGYKGTSEARVAMQREEIHALTQPWSALRAESATMLAERKINLLLQMGAERHPDLPQVPTLVDLGRNDDERRLLAMMVSGARIGRSVLSPPFQPAERVAGLRAAFVKTMKDEAFVTEMQKVGLDLDPMSGEDLQAMLVEIANISPALIAQARKMAEVERAR